MYGEIVQKSNWGQNSRSDQTEKEFECRTQIEFRLTEEFPTVEAPAGSLLLQKPQGRSTTIVQQQGRGLQMSGKSSKWSVKV